MDYILKHWRGQLSLKTSFWKNFIAINLLIAAINASYSFLDYAYDPRHVAVFVFLFNIFNLCLCWPWQMVGLWRSAFRHIRETHKMIWPCVIIAVVIIGCGFQVWRAKDNFYIMKENYQLASTPDENNSFQVTLADNHSVIVVQGFMGFGVTKEVRALLKKHPEIKGIVLDSNIGRYSEAFILSEIILHYQLNTTSSHGCQSVCVIPYIAGKNRTLEKGARLAFTSYETVYEDNKIQDEYDKIAQKVQSLFMQQNVDQNFISDMLEVPYQQFWQPSREQLIAANVIQDIKSFYVENRS